jgi:predicted metal-dependent HD superfamily phosphohydrolase
MSTRKRWNASWPGLAQAPAGLYEALAAAYAEPHRHYHTAQHLDECFAHFDAIGSLAAHPPEVALALWFHDAIYDPKRQDNEEKSADWARRALLAAGGAPEAAARVHALVMATRHAAVPRGRDEEVLVDIDLSILGAAPERFDEYERQVRAEYAWVPEFLFRRKRRQILEELLARASIFSTVPMREHLEARARANLGRSLERLG